MQALSLFVTFLNDFVEALFFNVIIVQLKKCRRSEPRWSRRSRSSPSMWTRSPRRDSQRWELGIRIGDFSPPDPSIFMLKSFTGRHPMLRRQSCYFGLQWNKISEKSVTYQVCHFTIICSFRSLCLNFRIRLSPDCYMFLCEVLLCPGCELHYGGLKIKT